MPVRLDEMMNNVSPEARARIERDAAALIAEYRERGDCERDVERSTSVRAVVGTKVKTGERCPESGVWRVENTPSATIPIAVHHRMPPFGDQAVTWELVGYAVA